MIPPFTDDGYLPPGAHPATLDEVAERFGQASEVRRVQVESVRWLVDAAKRAGVTRLVINGSFVTDALEPNDVDCVLLVDDRFPLDPAAGDELAEGLPFLELQIVRYDAFQVLVGEFFATDRLNRPKGVVEVIL